jgi:DNA-binding transcriptional MerR regulator
MVSEGLISAKEVAVRLNITMNNLRQLQHRKQLVWVERAGRNVYYREQDVVALAQRRAGRVQE